jgi:phage shock protein PspC (stress-responsive transcriptional regulator)
MKKTVQIHIGGRHFTIDEDAYQKLGHYLDALKSHFKAEGETGTEIVEDIEQRIAELIENKITNGKQVVNVADVDEIIRILGKVEDFVYAGQADEKAREQEYDSRRENRRFYRDPDHYYLGGVASGLGEYFNIDPLWIRLAFVCLIFLKGVGALIYVILWIVVPKARTTAEKLQMQGKPVNLSTIKDSVNAEYDKSRSNTDNFSRSSSGDRTRNALENIMRAIGAVVVVIFKFLIGAVGIFFIVMGSIFLAGLIMFILGFTSVFGHFQLWNGISLPDFAGMFATSGHYYLVVISLIIVILIPIAALIYGGTKMIFNIRSKHRILRAFLLTTWILALILLVTLILMNASNNTITASGSQSTAIETSDYPQIRVTMSDNTESKRITHYWVLGYRFNYSNWDETFYDKVELMVEPSQDNEMHLTVVKGIKNVGMRNSRRFLDRIDYNWDVRDSVLTLDKYFTTDDDDFWLFSDVKLKLRVPEGQVIVLSQNTCDMLVEEQRNKYCWSDSSLVGMPCEMTSAGVLAPVKQKTRSIRNK